MIKISNIINDNGRASANQFVITKGKYVWFQSYDSVVCKINESNGGVLLSEHWQYSNTTRKHLYMFFRQNGFNDLNNIRDVRKAIKDRRVIVKKVKSLAIE